MKLIIIEQKNFYFIINSFNSESHDSESLGILDCLNNIDEEEEYEESKKKLENSSDSNIKLNPELKKNVKEKFFMYVEDSMYLRFSDDFIKDKEFNYERFSSEQQNQIFDYITNLDDSEKKQINDLIYSFGLEGKRSVLTVCFFLMQIPNICFFKRNKYLEFTKHKLRLYFYFDSGRYNQRDLYDNLCILKNIKNLKDFNNFEYFLREIRRISDHLKTLNKKEFECFDFDKHVKYNVYFSYLKKQLSHLTNKELSEYFYYYMNTDFKPYFEDLLKFKFFFSETNFIINLKGHNEIIYFLENIINQNDNDLNFEINYIDSENEGFIIKSLWDLKLFFNYLKTLNNLETLEFKITFFEK